jgi:signal transduction histidine kinase/iron only hydrogenase large subunit-like protein
MRFDVVRTIEKKCRRCYNCVRFCPAKAIRVEKGQAIVVPERCIGCGNCVKVCTQNAKEIHSSIEHVKEMLESDRKMVAIVAPSFPAELDDNVTPGQYVTALKKMGYDKVVEVAFGADLVSREYKKLHGTGGKLQITSSCPSVNYFIEKYHPELIDNLTPVVSPMIATAIAVKKLYGKNCGVVFIGPCIAKKKEARDPDVAGWVDEVITFKESRKLRAMMGIEAADMEPSSFDPPHPSWGRAFPITGGSLKSSDLEHNLLDCNTEAVDGREKFLEFMDGLDPEEEKGKTAELLFCEGCINGPMMRAGVGIFNRRKRVADYISTTQRAFNVEDWQYYMKKFSRLNLSRTFTPQEVEMKLFSEEDITEKLHSFNKMSEADELNCRACGYESCRSLARAICEGLAEKEMCMSYTIDELEKTLKELHDSHKELQTTQQQLIQSEKQASLGQLAAGVAHELNNPLGTILLYSDLLVQETQKANGDEQEIEDLKMIAREATRCKNIVSGLLNFSRQRDVFCKEVNLNELLIEVTDLIKSQKKRDGITIEMDLDSNLPVVELDLEQIKQVIINLVMNAIEAMNEEGHVRIKTETVDDLEKVTFSVSDNGPGITKDNLKNLFTPFFTTKQVGQGTGLGLAICYGIIKMHRGDIKVDTELGQGTTFRVILPKVHNNASQKQLIEPSQGGRQTVSTYQPRRFRTAKKNNFQED